MSWRGNDEHWEQRVDDIADVVSARIMRGKVRSSKGIKYLDIASILTVTLATRLSRNDQPTLAYFKWRATKGCDPSSTPTAHVCSITQYYHFMSDDWKQVVDVLGSDQVIGALKALLSVKKKLALTNCNFIREHSGHKQHPADDYDKSFLRLELYLPPLERGVPARVKDETKLATKVLRYIDGEVRSIRPQKYNSNLAWAIVTKMDTMLARSESHSLRQTMVAYYSVPKK